MGCSEDGNLSVLDPTVTFVMLLEGIYEFRKALRGVLKEIGKLLFQRFLIAFDSEDVRGTFFLSSATNFLSV